MIRNLLFIDLETSGLNPESDKILEVAWTLTDLCYQQLAFGSFLVSTFAKSANSTSIEINGLESRFLRDNGISARSALSPLYALFRTREVAVVGYNVGFDLAFLYFAERGLRMQPVFPPAFEIKSVVREAFPNLVDGSLSAVYRHLFQPLQADIKFHRAWDDVVASKSVLEKLKQQIRFEELLIHQPDKKYLSYLFRDAVKSGFETEVLYSFESGSSTWYKLRPFSVDGRYLEALDTNTAAMKRFLLQRIISARFTGEQFPVPDYTPGSQESGSDY